MHIHVQAEGVKPCTSQMVNRALVIKLPRMAYIFIVISAHGSHIYIKINLQNKLTKNTKVPTKMQLKPSHCLKLI